MAETIDDLRAEVERLRAELAISRSAAQIEAAAREKGFIYPDLCIELLNTSDLLVDPETGRVKGINKALDKLAARRPEMIGSPDAPATRTNPPARPPARVRPTPPERNPELEAELWSQGGYLM